MNSIIILYSSALCGDCINIKEYMNRKGIQYLERDIKVDELHQKELIQQTGKLGVPYLLIEGRWIKAYPTEGVFDDIFAEKLFR